MKGLNCQIFSNVHSENLKWDEDINFIISKIFAKIDILRSLRNSVTLDTLRYNAIVQPHFDYADAVYVSTFEFNKIRI